jgi:(E)-4-hydroxy-3-methylbut-2-enyl-diphosphate synthase
MSFKRRKSHAVRVGITAIGGDNPIRLQSMTNTPTLDTDASAAQIERIAAAGADIVRLTAQGVNHARNLGEISRVVRDHGCNVPLVADIHFNPAAAFEAALHVEKVRINPGNFVDPGRTFRKIEYTDAEYAAEIDRIADKLVPLLDLCRERGVALRIGVNHGSLSDRIMSRYGDTPAGMVESAMEFLRICMANNFLNVVISIKASNVGLMVNTMRLMVKAMSDENMDFPLHLGVTEAGDGEDGRVKSAVGIGTLLAEGIGDTIRVSLSEAPENEIPVARLLVKHISEMQTVAPQVKAEHVAASPSVVGYDIPENEAELLCNVLAFEGPDALAQAKTAFASLTPESNKPNILKISYPATMSPDEVVVAASVDFGSVLLDGLADGIWMVAPSLDKQAVISLELSILQATRRRITKTEYIACPGCGRTLFDLQGTLAKIKEATSHLTGLKIGVMGCIVNGPGEMADADYGYVGAAKGNVSLYKGKECVVRNIPTDEALPQLIQIIKDNNDWIEPNLNS